MNSSMQPLPVTTHHRLLTDRWEPSHSVRNLIDLRNLQEAPGCKCPLLWLKEPGRADEVNTLVARRLAEAQQRLTHETLRLAPIRNNLACLADWTIPANLRWQRW